MNVETKIKQPLTAERIRRATVELLKLPQAECPVVHRFGPGVYIRQITMPAGVAAIGRKHRYEHTNIMLTGRALVLQDDGSVKELVAPLTFVGKPGQKVGVILEDMTWLNIYATDETDVAKLEEKLFEECKELNDAITQKLANALSGDRDRQDFATVGKKPRTFPQVGLTGLGFDYGFAISDSPIHGKGVFATQTFRSGDVIGPVVVVDGNPGETQLARYLNHAKSPNAVIVKSADGGLNAVAVFDIHGNGGGIIGSEITIDYRQYFSAIKNL